MPPSVTTPHRQPAHEWNHFFSIQLAAFVFSPGVCDADNLSAQLLSVCFWTDAGWLIHSLRCREGMDRRIKGPRSQFQSAFKALSVFIVKFVKVTKVACLRHPVCVCRGVPIPGPSRSEDMCVTRGNGRIGKARQKQPHVGFYLLLQEIIDGCDVLT